MPAERRAVKLNPDISLPHLEEEIHRHAQDNSCPAARVVGHRAVAARRGRDLREHRAAGPALRSRARAAWRLRLGSGLLGLARQPPRVGQGALGTRAPRLLLASEPLART